MSKSLFTEIRELDAISEHTNSIKKDPFLQVQDRIFTVHHKVEQGDLIAFDGLIELEATRKKLEATLELIKEFKSDFFSQLHNESEEYKDGYKGFKIEVRNGGKSFVYKQIPEWITAEETKKKVEAKYKSMFIAIENGSPNANISEDGEILPLPELTYRKSSVILKTI